jgi:hypothetical protein
VCQHLAAKGDHRSLISLVTRWAQTGEPTQVARLAEARSFLELRMVDKAIGRVRDLVDADPPEVEALLIVGEAQLIRGWTREGRKSAERGLGIRPDHAGLRALLERASEAPTNPEEEASEAETASPAELIRLAEHQMALGAFVRARGLLERVRRKVPDHRWAKDLLWAIDGEYLAEGSLAELCERWGPELPVLTEISAADDVEHTESARSRDLDLDDRRSSRAFPALFRNLANGATGEEPSSEPELTAVSAMAQSTQLRATEPGERTDPGGDDTQIVRILKPARSTGQDPDAQVTAVNLAELRVAAKSKSAGAQDYAGGDDEDDALIVHTRREDATDATVKREDDGFTEELAIEKAATQRGAVEDAHWAATPLVGTPRADAAMAEVNQPHRRVDAAALTAAPKEKSSLAAKAPPATATPVSVGRTSRPPPQPPSSTSLWVVVMVFLFVFAGGAFVLLAILLAVGS